MEAAHAAEDVVQVTSLSKKIFIGTTALTSFAAVVGASISMSISSSPVVIQGVTAYNTDLSGMTRAQVKDFFTQYYTARANPIQLVDGDRTWTLNPEDVDLSVNIDQVTNEIFDLGRNGTFWGNMNEQIDCYQHPRDFSLISTYNPNKLNDKLSAIATDIHQDPVNADAYMSNGTIYRVPGKIGRKWDPKPTAESLDAPYRSLNLPKVIPLTVEEVQPYITTEDVNAIDSIIASYTTYYSPGDRGDNIDLAASKLNYSPILKPGTVFSFNDTVGDRTAAEGYRLANVIINGKYELGSGGGVCQVSSTLYNAVLLAGLTPTERTAHYYPSSYVPAGRDATVAYGSLDFKFRNDLPHAVTVAATTSGDSITTYVLGSKADIAGKNISLVTEGSALRPSLYRVVDDGYNVSSEYMHTDVYYEHDDDE